MKRGTIMLYVVALYLHADVFPHHTLSEGYVLCLESEDFSGTFTSIGRIGTVIEETECRYDASVGR